MTLMTAHLLGDAQLAPKVYGVWAV
jgi:hypothetical protein